MQTYRATLSSLGLAAGCLFVAAPAAAQSCSTSACRASNAVQVRVGTMMRLGVSGSTTVLASPATAPQAAVDGPSATVKSNGRWKLQISAAQPTWTVEGTGGRPDKPASDLLWSLGGDDRFSAVTTTPADVAAGAATAGTTLPLHYRTQFTPSADAPATYSLVVRLTLVGA